MTNKVAHKTTRIANGLYSDFFRKSAIRTAGTRTYETLRARESEFRECYQ